MEAGWSQKVKRDALSGTDIYKLHSFEGGTNSARIRHYCRTNAALIQHQFDANVMLIRYTSDAHLTLI